MFSFLTVLEGDFVIAGVCLVLGMLFKTKITDFFKGIPADVRTALNNVEKDTLAKIKGAQATVVATLPAPAPAKVALAPAPVAAAPATPALAPVAPLAPIAPVAPVAPVA